MRKIRAAWVVGAALAVGCWGRAATAEPGKVTRVGVINWDCSAPSDTTWFGGYQVRSLSPAKYRHLTPYYADVLGPDKIAYHRRTPEEYDRELQYAVDAGIDYMAYCWYGEDATAKRVPVAPGRGASCENYLHEITWARRFHAESALREKLKLCAILLGNHVYTDGEIDNLVRAMKEPWYETVDGRPLCYVLCNAGKVLQRVRAVAGRQGLKPYMALVQGAKVNRSEADLADALTSYAPPAPPRDGAFLRYCWQMKFRLPAHGVRLFAAGELPKDEVVPTPLAGASLAGSQ